MMKRLIEVALPIREISAESVRDKNIHHAHISHFHIWWARRPLATARAVVFASLLPDPDDPNCPPEFRAAVLRLLRDEVPPILKGYWRGRKSVRDPDPYQPYEGIPDTPRNRLLTFMAKWSPEWLAFEGGEEGNAQPPPGLMLDDRCLVKWETSDPKNEQGRAVLGIARELVRAAYGDVPVVLDPFAGGGAIPLEATRLGCQAIANDYNPVAYLILRATCEFPQRFGGVRSQESGVKGQEVEGKRQEDEGQLALAETRELKSGIENRLVHDVEEWAKWILERARERIGHLYPPGEDGLPVVGYLWARTAPCSNPTCRAEIPLLRSLLACKKKGKRVALTMMRNQVFDKNLVSGTITFGIAKGKVIQRTDGTMLTRGNCRCPFCEQVTPVEDIRRAGQEGRLGERMVAVITDTPHGKDYRPVEPGDLRAFEEAVRLAEGVERPGEYIVPEINAPNAPPDAGAHRSISVDIYGFKTFGALFNDRQLVAMQTFVACLHDVLIELEQQESSVEYRQVIAAYLGLWISRSASFMCTLCRWASGSEIVKTPFGGQAIPMIWDYPEVNPLAHSSGTASTQLRYMLDVVRHESPPCDVLVKPANVLCGDGAQLPFSHSTVEVVVTDPPYFDAIAYADLSDFFYVWLKRSLSNAFPEAFATPQTPKIEEAVAHKHRHHGDRQKGKDHFQQKLTECFAEARRVCTPGGVIAVMFAHQSTEAWTSLINALFEAGLTISATYPIETEMKSTVLALGTASLESSITVICRPREVEAAGSFREVRREIERVVAESVRRFWDYGFRGADLIVACYGPAVGVFGRYERVERADGRPVEVPELLELAREAALKAIAGEFTGDSLSRLYFVWANLYGVGEQAWDDARLVVQIGGDSEEAMQVARQRGLFVVDGAKCRLAMLRDRAKKPGFFKKPGFPEDEPLIDQLHRAMQLWKSEQRGDLVIYLRERDLLEHAPFWKLAQALFEVLPRGEEDRKLISALLGERETLRIEARQAEAPAGPAQLELL